MLIITVSSFLIIQAQDARPKLRGVQVGYPGIWFYREIKVIKTLYIRNEFGVERYSGYKNSECDFRNKPFEPIISFVPKWYYNLSSRNEKYKDVSDLAGNFFSINARANLNPFAKFENHINQLSIIPTWGVRRNINRYLNYEFTVGYGYYETNLYNLYCSSDNFDFGFTLDIQARIGFKF